MGGGFGGGIHRNTWVGEYRSVRDGEFKQGPGCAVCPDTRVGPIHVRDKSSIQVRVCYFLDLSVHVYIVYIRVCASVLLS